MRSRAIIEQAKGILMAASPDLDADGAFDVLRRASQRENVKLREIAGRIVGRRRPHYRTFGLGPVTQQQHPRGSMLRAGQDHLGLSLHDVWLGYISVGGNAPLREVQGWLTGLAEPGDDDHDLMAQALNDRFVDQGLNHPVAYTDTLGS